MMKLVAVLFAIALVPACVYAVDGQTLINQATVTAAGGFPYVISQPGSYKLSGNLTDNNCSANAISIQADNVTLDLNGFSLTMTCTAYNGTGSNTGVYAVGKNATVLNGAVINFGDSGIQLWNGGIVEKVKAIGSYNQGILVHYGGTVVNCLAQGNAEGFDILQGVISNSTAQGNITGIFASQSTVLGNTVIGNQLGIHASSNSIVGSNTIAGNSSQDLDLTGGLSQHNNSCTAGSC